MLVNAPQIVQYQGSKRLLAPKILEFFPKTINTLFEPFSGMAALTIAAAQQKRASAYHLNDLNAPLVRILQSAIETPDSLINEYSKIWNEQFIFSEGSIQHFYKVRDEFNNGDKSAAKLLYLIARCVKGSVRYGSNGKFNQSPDKRRNGTKPSTLKPRLYEISALLKDKTDFTAVDYREIFEMAKERDLIYMDPPYQGVSNVRDNRYFSGVSLDEFAESLEVLNKRNVDFIISYDGNCGDKTYGKDLPSELGCKKILLNAGYSSQAILLGRKEITQEALYISRNLVKEDPFSSSIVQPEFDFGYAV